jgi:type II secretory pathway component PulM
VAEQGRVANLFAFFDRLSTRERVMVGGLSGAVFLTVVVLVWLVVGGQIEDLRARNQAVRDTLAQIMTRKDKFLRDKERLEAEKKRLEGNDVKLVQVMESEGSRLGITIEDFKEHKRALTENWRKVKKRGDDEKAPAAAATPKDLVEESQTVTIRKVTLEQLAQFMAALEGRPEPIKVTQLDVDTLQSDRQLLREVRMTVSTYKKTEYVP